MIRFLSAQDEGYAALLISIVNNVGVDESFRLLQGRAKGSTGIRTSYRHWDRESLERAIDMRRREFTWEEIGRSFGVSGAGVRIAVKRYAAETVSKTTNSGGILSERN